MKIDSKCFIRNHNCVVYIVKFDWTKNLIGMAGKWISEKALTLPKHIFPLHISVRWYDYRINISRSVYKSIDCIGLNN